MLNKFMTRAFVVLCIVSLIFSLVGCKELNETIFVTSYDGERQFSHTVDNVRILATGCNYEFETKTDVFSQFLDSYEVFEKKSDRVSIIFQNEIFTLKKLFTDKYILYGEYIILVKDNEIYEIPFPTDCLIEDYNGVPRMNFGSFKVKDLSYEYLEKFYSRYSEIKIEGNQIIGKTFVLEMYSGDNAEYYSIVVPTIKKES